MFLKSVLTVVIAVIVAASVSARAEQSSDPCTHMLVKYLNSVPPWIADRRDSGEAVWWSFKGVKASVIPANFQATGPWGHAIRLLKRVRRSWTSSYSVGGNNHGTTVSLIDVLGPKAALFFGFRLVSDSEFWVPTAEELNAAIEGFNENLSAQDMIKIRFYATENMAFEGEPYLKEFLFDRLPYARGGFYEVHDVAFHLSAIFLPGQIHDLLKQRIERELQIVEKISAEPKVRRRSFLSMIFSDNYTPQERAQLRITQLVRNIDGLGNLIPALFYSLLTKEGFIANTGVLEEIEHSHLDVDAATLLELISQRIQFVRSRAEAFVETDPSRFLGPITTVVPSK